MEETRDIRRGGEPIGQMLPQHVVRARRRKFSVGHSSRSCPSAASSDGKIKTRRRAATRRHSLRKTGRSADRRCSSTSTLRTASKPRSRKGNEVPEARTTRTFPGDGAPSALGSTAVKVTSAYFPKPSPAEPTSNIFSAGFSRKMSRARGNGRPRPD